MVEDVASGFDVAIVGVWWRDVSCDINSVVGPGTTPMIPELQVLRADNLHVGKPVVSVSGDRDRKDACGPGEEEDCLEHCRWRQE